MMDSVLRSLAFRAAPANSSSLANLLKRETLRLHSRLSSSVFSCPCADSASSRSASRALL